MIRNTYEDIVNGVELRQNLSLIRQELKDDHEKRALLYFLSGDYHVFQELLTHEDPKVRKNTALILGMIGDKKLLPCLMEAYEKEETLFVKSTYLIAAREFDFREYLSSFKERLKELSGKEITMENKKHLTEEMRALTELVIMAEGVQSHKFTGYKAVNEIILLTNRNYTTRLLEELPEDTQGKVFNAGIMATCENLKEILELRFYEELLFVVKGMKTCSMNPEEAARKMVEAKLLSFLEERHEGKTPFYFRIEMKSKMPLDKKAVFTKKLSNELERLTQRKLINSTSHYEVEIRLIENKSGMFNVLIKLFTLKDTRFDYRREVIAASLKPVNAALTCILASDYLKEDAKILDPFCGTGTMLIECHKFKEANTMYGIDLFGEAIEKAKINTQEAHQIIHYINRDFFDFKHEYLFDEIISNMPWLIGRNTQTDIEKIYDRFFEKAKSHLTNDGIIVLYTHNRELVKRYALKYNYSMKAEWEISMKEGTYVNVLHV